MNFFFVILESTLVRNSGNIIYNFLKVDQSEVERLYLLVQKFALVFLLQEIIWSLIKVEDYKNPRPSSEFDILGYGIKRYEQYKKSKINILSVNI